MHTKQLLAKLVLAFVTTVAAVTAMPTSPAQAASCTFYAPAPSQDGGNVKAVAPIRDCGGGITWYLTIQRHRGGPWWQNEARNWRNGDGDLTTIDGCVPGARTYRAILTSSSGHQSVSGHARITC